MKHCFNALSKMLAGLEAELYAQVMACKGKSDQSPGLPGTTRLKTRRNLKEYGLCAGGPSGGQ